MAPKDRDRQPDPGGDPLEQPLGGVGSRGDFPDDPGVDFDPDDPLGGLGGDLGQFGGDMMGVGAPPPGGDEDGRGRRKPGQPYTADVIAVRAVVTPGIYQRCRAYWARRPDQADVLTPAEQLTWYLELATFQHAMDDQQRPQDQQLYDWGELHMAGIRPLLQQEMQAERESIAKESARGARAAVLARIASFAPQEVLNAIREMDRDGQ